MARLVSTSGWTALVAVTALAGCSSSGDTAAANTTTGAGGNSGAGGATSVAASGATTTAAMTATSTTVASTVSATTGAGGAGFMCDPPADPGSIYELEAPALGAGPVSMCEYRGDVVLVVNTAAA